MKKSVGIAVGLAVAAGAWIAGTWYTGSQVEQMLNRSIAETNQEMKLLMPGSGVTPSLELISLEQGLFASTARYRLKASGALALGDEPTPVDGELLFVDHIEHGPFPLSRITKLQLLPVMAKSNFALEPSPSVAKWFALTQGESPLTGDSSIGYNQDVSGTLNVRPLEYLQDGSSLSFSGLDLDFDVSGDRTAVKFDAGMNNLTLASKDKLRIELQELSLDSDTVKGESTLGLGDSHGLIKQIKVETGENQALLIKDLSLKGQLGENAQGLFGSAGYQTGMVSFAGTDLGSVGLAYSIKNLHAASVKELVELYRELLTNLDASTFDANDPDFDLTDEQKTQLQAHIDTLLAGKPVLALDNLTLKTANGESRFNLALGLSKPSSYELPPQALLMEGLSSLDARLVVSKPMIKDVMLLKESFEPSADPAAAQAQAEQMAEMAGGMAVGMQMATLEGSDIVASLNYADGQVDFNGRKMPVEEFMAMAMGMVPGAGGMTGADEEEALEGEPSEYDEETQETEEAE